MSLLDRHPDTLIARHEPAEVLAALRQSTALTPDQARRLDAYLLHWSNLILHRPQDREGVQELLNLCEQARDQIEALREPEMQGLHQRWSTFEDLLELRRRVLLRQADTEASSQHGRTAEILKLGRQDEILALLGRAERVRQADLATQLQLSAGRVSQLLGVLEERSLITRQREGRECWVSRTHLGSLPTETASSHTPSPATLWAA